MVGVFVMGRPVKFVGCHFPNCDGKHYSLGLCTKHYHNRRGRIRNAVALDTFILIVTRFPALPKGVREPRKDLTAYQRVKGNGHARLCPKCGKVTHTKPPFLCPLCTMRTPSRAKRRLIGNE